MYEEVTLSALKTHYCETNSFLVVFIISAECDKIKTNMCHQTTSPLLCVQHIHGEPARRTADWM